MNVILFFCSVVSSVSESSSAFPRTIVRGVLISCAKADIFCFFSCSGIKEFDDCLSAIDDMRDAFRESLEKQWKTEQEKKQQMSALAHDIKNISRMRFRTLQHSMLSVRIAISPDTSISFSFFEGAFYWTTECDDFMSGIGAVAIIIIQSIRFVKIIKKQMQPVLDAIGQIKDQTL